MEVGERRNRWELIRRLDDPYVAPSGKRFRRALFRCDCGAEHVVRVSNVVSGRSSQCVDCGRASARAASVTHGASGTRLWGVWCDVRRRTRSYYGERHPAYRGVTITPEWESSFENFAAWAESNGYEPGLHLDRIDPTRGYSPSNCQFLSPSAHGKKTRQDEAARGGRGRKEP